MRQPSPVPTVPVTPRLPATLRQPPPVLALRTVVLVAPLVALLLTGTVAEPPSLVVLVVALVLSARSAVAPESATTTLVLLVVLWWWGVAVGDAAGSLPPASLAAAALVWATHLAATVLGYGPGVVPGRALVRTWLLRGLVGLAVAGLVWGVAAQALDAAIPAWVPLVGLGVVAGALLAASTVLTGRVSQSTTGTEA